MPAVAEPAPLPVETERAQLTDIHETEQAPAELRRERRSVTIPLVTFLSALALASCSGYFSIVGLTAIFAGAYWPVVGMGVAFEVAKLSAVAWLGRCGRGGSRSLAASLGVLVALLIGLNSIGVYGFLAKAHIQHAVAGEIGVDARTAEVGARIAVQTNTIADLDKRISQIDTAIDEATRRGRTNSAMNLAEQQRRNRAELGANRSKEAQILAGLQVETAAVQSERKKAEADLGPVRYLSTLIGTTDDATMRSFILFVSLLLDPAAILLLLAATCRK